MASLEVDNMDTTRTFGSTVKQSNLAHNGFHDLLAMLPTGSGTGASAFFASTPGNTFDKDVKVEPQECFIKHSVRQQEKIGDCDSQETRPDGGDWAAQTFGRSEIRGEVPDGLPREERSPRPLPPIPDVQGFPPPSGQTQILPATPTSAHFPLQTACPAAKSPQLRVPAPAMSPSRPMVRKQRPPLSPPISSAIAVFASHSPIRDGLHATQRFTASITNRFSAAATPLVTSQKAVTDKAPRMVEHSGKIGRVGDPSPPRYGQRQTTGVKSGGAATIGGKVDKRLISWPMDFR